METKKLPIGYWVKQVDQLLTNAIDNIQSSFGLTRTDWQILHSLAENASVDKNELIVLMKPFLHSTSFERAVHQLKDRDFIDETGNRLSLTEKGKKQHTACLERQKEFRQNTMTGVSEEQYQTTIITLQRIVENIKGNAE